jgi:hypothetical protein
MFVPLYIAVRIDRECLHVANDISSEEVYVLDMHRYEYISSSSMLPLSIYLSYLDYVQNHREQFESMMDIYLLQ